MILTCPSCGATASACAWENDIAARETMQAIIDLPTPVAKTCLGYLSLFRPNKRALTWKKAKTLILELSALIAPGHIQVQGKPARTCPPQLWAMAMAQMVDRAASLQRPLKNHNYLRQIVYQLADQADAKQEQQVRQAEQTGATKIRRPGGDDMSPEMRRYLAERGEPVVSPEAQGALQGILQKFKDRQRAFDAE